MRISIQRDNLLSALKAVVGVVQDNSTMAVLRTVAIRVTGQQVVVTGTNLETAVSMAAIADSAEDGAFCFPAAKLFALCRAFDADVVDINVLNDGKFATITNGRGLYRLALLPYEEFPSIEDVHGGPDRKVDTVSATVDAPEFIKALSRVSCAQGHNDVRTYLNSTLFDVTSANRPARLVATDGHRLALSKVTMTLDPSVSVTHLSANVPYRTVLALLSACADATGQMAIDFVCVNDEPTLMRCVSGSYSLATKLIAGKYPEYRKVIPEPEASRSARVSATDIAGAVGRMMAIREQAALLPGSLEIKEGELLMACENKAEDAADETVRCSTDNVSLPSSAPRFGVNLNYLCDAMKAIGGNDAILQWPEDGAHAMRITVVDDPSYLHIIMPTRL